MAKLPTREQLMKKGKLYRKLMAAFLKLQNPLPGDKSLRNEIYIDTASGKVRTLWYGFKNPKITPIYFDIHGGGFVFGNADMDEAMNLDIIRKVGCKIISIDYAKAPEYPYPVALNQVYEVINHVFDHSEEYAVDNKKMAIGGHSAGANLSTVTCMRTKKEGKLQFACQIMDYPILDMATDPFEKPQPKGSISPQMAMMFNTCYVLPDQTRDPQVSPIYASVEDLTGLPPALFILAGKDSLHNEGVKYCNMLNTAGVVTELHEYSNATHGFTYRISAETIDAREKMADFLKVHFETI